MTKKTSFKGFGISEMNFERKREKCSKVVEGSCSARDCNLEVYKLGDDIIYSGGLCPKGNTGIMGKRAPDYIRMYLSLLENHLSKVSKPIDESGGKGRILVPRSLTFLNEKGVFYCSIYHNLGFEVCVSPESDEEISNLGKASSHSEFCYPLILAHGHAVYLKERMKEGDKLLLVDAIGSEYKKYKFCPYVASSGHVIRGNLNLKKEEVLIPIIYFNDKHYPIHKAVYKDLQRVFGDKFSLRQVSDAVNKALEDEKSFLDNVHSKGDEILKGLKERGEKAYIGVGRGYTLFDSKASSSVHELFIINGLHYIPVYFIGLKKYEIDKIVENMYWHQGRRMLAQTWFSLEEKKLFPVRLTNFNCGPDSIVYYHEEKLANQFNKPWLVLETDGHNSNAQFGTRIQAHNRVVDKYLENPSKSEFEYPPEISKDFIGKIIGVPYMGDGSDLFVATLKAIGLNAEVIPTRTPKSIEISKRIINTNTCRPFSFQIGDHIAWLESLREKGIDVNTKAAVFMPSTKGPCRFGQYYVVLRKFFNERGFDKVTIINPNSANEYNDINLPQMKKLLVLRLFFKCNLANEILKSCLLRSRPYEINKGESDKVYDKAHQELIKLAETSPGLGKLYRFLKNKLKEFENIEKNDKERFPLVLMNGEIFLRNHEISNCDSIKLLENHRLEIILDPVYTWINYVNKNFKQKSLQRKDFSLFGMSLIKSVYINQVAKKLFSPFIKFLEGREFHDISHLIEKSEQDLIYHSAIEGESPVSIGTVYSFVKDELLIDGIYHVGPLGCMQETIATSRAQSLINQEKGLGNTKLIPFMDAVFGDSPIANLDSQIAIFAENCWLRKEVREGKLNPLENQEKKQGKNL